jgi:hypothetical protein
MSKEKKKPNNILLSYLFLENATHIIALDQVIIFFKNIIFICLVFILLSLVSKFLNCADAIFEIVAFLFQKTPKVLSQLFSQSKEQFTDLFTCIEKQIQSVRSDAVFMTIFYTLCIFIVLGVLMYIVCGTWRWVAKWIVITEAQKKDPSAKSVLGFKIFNFIFGSFLWIVVAILVYSFIIKLINTIQKQKSNYSTLFKI